MPTGLYQDPEEERARLARSRQSWDRIHAARQTVTAADAQAASTMAANYPHMSPGTIVPLARAGVAPDDPLAQDVALREAKSNKKKRGFMGRLGDIVGGITHIPAAGLDFGVSHVLNPLGGAALGVAKPVARRTLAGFTFLPELGVAGVRTAADVGGNIGAGVASGAAVGAGVGSFFGGVGALPGVAVGAIAGGVAGIGAGAVAEARGVNIESEGGLENPFSQTTIGQVAAGKSLGSGYMPGGEAAQAQAASARRSAAISGHALTPGRYIASTVVEPGTAPYNLLSGVMDATVAWKLDPTAELLKRAPKVGSIARADATRFLPSEGELRRLAAQDAGLVDGARKTIIGEKVEAWLGSKKGEKALQWFADNDFETIRKGLGGDKVDVGIVRDLADAKTIEEVDGILRPNLGLTAGLEMKPKVGGFGMEVKRKAADLPFFEKVADSRLWADLPSGRIKYDDATDATHQFELLLRDAGVAPDEVAGHTRQFAESLLEGSFEGRRRADGIVYQAMGGAKGKVAQSDAGRAFMNKVGRRAAASDNEVLRALIDEDVTKTPSLHVSINGKTTGLPPASYLTDYIDNGIDVDRSTLRGIRSATSKYSRVMNNSKLQTGTTFLDHVTNDMWKPTALLRGAWTVRVIGEEQVRMAAAGRLSLFNHPLSYLSWAMDDEGRIANIFKKHGVDIGGRGGSDVLGESFTKGGSTIIPDVDALEADLLDAGSEHFGEAVNWQHQNDGWQGDGFTRESHQETFTRGAAGHVEAVAENIDTAFSDPLVRQLATNPVHVVREWFLTGEGNELRQALIKKHGAPLQSRADVDRAIEGARRKLNSILGQVDSPPNPNVAPLAPRSVRETQPGMEVMGTSRPTTTIRPPETPTPKPQWEPYRPSEARPTGPTGPRPYGAREPAAPVPPGLNPIDPAKLARRSVGGPHDPLSGLGGTSPAPTYAPRGASPKPGSPAIREAIATGELNGVPLRDKRGRINKDFLNELKQVEDLPDQIVGTAARADKKWATKRDNTTQWLFTNLMTKPSAKLSRSPMFRQTYWDEAKNLMTELEPAAQQRLLANAEAAKLGKADLDALRLRARSGAGDLTLHEADTLAKGRALDQTQTLLYDAAQRGQMSDVLRIIMPFAEAQKEVMGVWAKVGLVDNPAVLRRAQQVLSAARGSGAFYKDPTTGEEMFTFPGSEFLTDKIIGMPIPLTGRAAGLNTFGSGIIPGMGPAVQIPTRYLLPDKPQFDDLHKFLDPFGSTAGESEGILEQQFPSWLTSVKRAMSASDSDRTFANAVKDVWAQGVSAGRYRTDTPEEIQEGLDHAKTAARWLYIIKGGASVLGAPTPPSPSYMAMDKDGKWHMAKVLSEDYRKMIDDPNIGFDGASQAFLEKYGNNAFAFMQAKTYSTVPAAPSTVDYRAWTGTKEGQAAAKHKDIGALFGPQGEGFDYNSYLRNIKSGDTVNLTPEQFTEQTNNRLATMIYYNQRDKFGPTPSKEQRAWLSDLKDQLREKFPGYGVELPGKPTADKAKNEYIPAIAKAVNDPALENNDVARAAKLYLQARSAALESVKAAGGTSFESAKAAAPIRDWLRQILDQLTERVPDFAPMAERVFDREMINDEENAQIATTAAVA